MVNSTISLVVTTYNSYEVLRNFFIWMLESYPLFDEVIIVDDCSSDESFLLIRDWVNKNDVESKVLLITTPRNSGRPSVPRNMGVEKASMDVIVFLDIDDLIPLGYIKHIRSLKPVEIITCTKSRYKDTSHFDFRKMYDCKKVRYLTKLDIKSKNQITFSGTAVPTYVAKKYKFENCVLEDWLYWRAISANEDVSFVKYLLVPIGYFNKTTLSPPKLRQVKRVAQIIGWRGMPLYFLLHARQRLEEFVVELRGLNHL